MVVGGSGGVFEEHGDFVVVVHHSHTDQSLTGEAFGEKAAVLLGNVAFVFGISDEATLLVVVECRAVVVLIGATCPTYSFRCKRIVLDHLRHVLIVEVGEQYADGGV